MSFWCGVRPASSGGEQCRLPALLETGRWVKEEQQTEGAGVELEREGAGAVLESGGLEEELDASQVSWKREAGRC